MAVRESLFQIGEDIEALDRLLDELEGDITGEEETITQWIEENEDRLEEKIDGYAFYHDELKERAGSLKAMYRQLRDRKKALENRARRLKDQLHYFMERHGREELKGATRKAKIQGAGGKYPVDVRVEDPKQLPREFGDLELVEKQVSYRVNRDAIREACGNEPGFIALVDGELIAGISPEDMKILQSGEDIDVQILAEVQDRGSYVRFW